MEMADDLQSLLDRINSEGVKKAEAERDAIIAAAKLEAEKIVGAAREEAAAATAATPRGARPAPRLPGST